MVPLTIFGSFGQILSPAPCLADRSVEGAIQVVDSTTPVARAFVRFGGPQAHDHSLVGCLKSPTSGISKCEKYVALGRRWRRFYRLWKRTSDWGFRGANISPMCCRGWPAGRCPKPPHLRRWRGSLAGQPNSCPAGTQAWGSPNAYITHSAISNSRSTWKPYGLP